MVKDAAIRKNNLDNSLNDEQPISPGILKLRKFFRKPTAVISLAILVFFISIAVLAPIISPSDPDSGNIRQRLQQPGREYVFGTDQQGRDMLSRVIFGSRVALLVGFSTVAIGLLVGGMLGVIAGYMKGWIDSLIMRIMDLMLSFPYILLVVAIVSMTGPGLRNAVIAIGIANIPQFARIVRGVVIGLREREFISAVEALGGSRLRIIFFHIIPNAMAPLIVTSTLYFGRNVLAEATLSFLGLGIQPPTAAWGSMVSFGREYLMTYPHLSLIPGAAIMLFVYALNMFGDALRDVFDPKSIR